MKFRHIVLSVACTALLASACGDDGASPGDGAVDAPSDGERIGPPSDPTAPMPAALPELTPCPSGWREVAVDEGIATCDPWPEGGKLDCADGQAHFPGEPGCTQIGTACPTGDFPVGLPVDATVVHVLAGAPAPGDGSLPSPYPTLTAALTVAPVSGTVVAIGKGAYDEAVDVPAGITLWGACPTETTWSSALPGTIMAGVALVRGADAEIRNLGFGSSARPAVVVAGVGRSAMLRDVIVHGMTAGGIVAAVGGSLTARSIAIRETEPGIPPNIGRAVSSEMAGQLTLERALIEGNTNGVQVGGVGAVLELDGVAVYDSRRRIRNTGRGAEVLLGGEATFRRSVLSHADAIGIQVGGSGASLTLEDVVLSETEPNADDLGGYGIDTSQGVTLTGRRVLLDRNRAVGALIRVDSTARLEDLVARDGQAEVLGGRGGIGAFVQQQMSGRTRAEIVRAAFLRNRDTGLGVIGDGGTLVAEDITVLDTATRVLDGAGGVGVVAGTSAELDLARARIEGSIDVGMLVQRATARLADVIVADTSARFDGKTGSGLSAHDASVSIERSLFERNREVTLYIGESTAALLTDLSIRNTLVRECADSACADEPAGHGLGVYAGEAMLERFHIGGSPLCGIQLANSGTVDLLDGTITDNVIGVCVQVEGFDLTRVTGRVLYERNEENTQTTSLPIPEQRLMSL